MSDNATRYCYLSTLADWSAIEKLLRSSSATSATELKADLDALLDEAIRTASPVHLQAMREVAR